ncbi:transglycosylase SLT domain-containing protein [Kosmotoga olearia]|uniref:Transglycosylase SLT domain-containing protein n=1 Tax=Kosmotoga olearia (strain ATCC BAA-1733 / DSM 21960 / TBF 19.5.1) TaxID=521045 RepID=C5CIS0_KOSOT|nr:transglycosylase SLT domain-containing protein [Kosmotoga olearia]ACR78911.1 hypothetical protein Kole_0185 [Kosmotoga olearia TBF 19.5.1]
MSGEKKYDLPVFLLILSIIVGLAAIIWYMPTNPRILTGKQTEKIRRLSVLYNAGLNSDCGAILSNESYDYDDSVLEAYRYFFGINRKPIVMLAGIKTVDNKGKKIFSSNPVIESYVNKNMRKVMPELRKRIERAVLSLNSFSKSDTTFKKRIAQEIYHAIMDFSSAKVALTINNETIDLDLSKVDPYLVASIMLVESMMNPYAVAEERSIKQDFSDTIYSRGLMQIYETTFWQLKSWINNSELDMTVDDLWSIRNNIFLGMVYLAYAQTLIER